MNALLLPASAALAAALLLPTPAPLGDRVVQSGETVVYDTAGGPLRLRRLEIQAGGVLRVVGAQPFKVVAQELRIDGELILDGLDHPGVLWLNTPQVPVLGADGGPAGGVGGTASALTTAATPAGLAGGGPAGTLLLGGRGGESAYLLGSAVARRAAGGGGGVLGPAAPPVPADLEDPLNLGWVALPGRDGATGASGAVSQTPPARGGAAGTGVFVDASPDNDFFGRKATTGGVVLGELAAPLAGQGGGGGGDSVQTASWPPATLVPTQNDQGGAGGGGGGLGLLLARRIVVGPQGRIRADGGAGGAGENTLFFDRIGGGGGGGSGGMLLLQAELIDLSAASASALQALGGAGGAGANDVERAEGGGGHGGPGLIQLHVPGGDPANVLLPAGATLADVSAPAAHVLLVEPGL